MSSSDEKQQLFRRIIMDHYQNPRNGKLAENPAGYMTVHLKNPSCGDDLTVQIRVRGDKIEEIRQQGAGCSICCASASMMAELLEAETIDQAGKIIEQFDFMIQAEPFDEDMIGDAISLQGVSRLPQRVKCATLAWQACKRGLDKIAETRSEMDADQIAQHSGVEGHTEASVEDEA